MWKKSSREIETVCELFPQRFLRVFFSLRHRKHFPRSGFTKCFAATVFASVRESPKDKIIAPQVTKPGLSARHATYERLEVCDKVITELLKSKQVKNSCRIPFCWKNNHRMKSKTKPIERSIGCLTTHVNWNGRNFICFSVECRININNLIAWYESVLLKSPCEGCVS